jgi:hypothetical protein
MHACCEKRGIKLPTAPVQLPLVRVSLVVLLPPP